MRLRPRNRLKHITSNTKVKGKPVLTEPDCSEVSAASPPPYNRAIAIKPCEMAQKIRCGTGASSLPPAVMVSITNEPESEEVMKNTKTRIIAMIEVIMPRGKLFNIWNKVNEASVTP